MSSAVMTAPAEVRQEAAEQLMRTATGFMYSALLYNAARLNIADLLADGPHHVSELAGETGANEDALYRALRTLATTGIFAETAPRTFAMTPAAEGLRTGISGSMRDMVLWAGNRFHFHVWAELPYSLRTGKPAVDYLYGKPIFDCLMEMPEVAHDFNGAMTVLSARLAPAVMEAYDFSSIGVLMDVAGGHGRTLCDILDRYPGMRGIVFDLESVLEGARTFIRSRGLEGRCGTAAGNFFDGIPAGADAYYLQHIIHDWDDEPALKILANCRRAMAGRPGARLVVVDCVMPENGTPHMSGLLDLEMMLMPGGRERTGSEWHSLMSRAGFRIEQIVAATEAESVIEARPDVT